MIPKKIHYCWFGRGEMPKDVLCCLNSWEKHLSDYEFILWNEDNFNININQYVKEAYNSKKYAFVTDYVRLYALYHYGGIYMDTDVEVLRPLDIFLKHSAFTGCENKNMCVTGIMGAEKEHKWIKSLLDDYIGEKFILPDGSYNKTTNTQRITKITINEFGWQPKNEYQELVNDLAIYPYEVFCAKDWKTGRIESNDNTYTIHHFSGSWHTNFDKFKNMIINKLGPNLTKLIVKLKKKILRN